MERKIPAASYEFDLDSVEEIRGLISPILSEYLMARDSIKYRISFVAEFYKGTTDSWIEFQYHSKYRTLLNLLQVETSIESTIQDVLDEFDGWKDSFNERGSGYYFVKLVKIVLKVVGINQLKGGTYIPITIKSNALVNVKNTTDNRCFLWSILAKLHPVKEHRYRVGKYTQYINEINLGDVEFPVDIRDISEIEKLNSLHINVFGLRDINTKESIYSIRLTEDYDNPNVIDLLLVKNYYCLITDLCLFLTSQNYNRVFLCRKCLQVKYSQDALDNHKAICTDFKVSIEVPKIDKRILKFKNYHISVRKPFVFYAILDYVTMDDKSLELSQWTLFTSSDYEDIIKSDIISNTTVESFVETVIKKFEHIKNEMDRYKHPSLSDLDETDYKAAEQCFLCSRPFVNSKKIREHNHYNGKYRGAACQSCNTKDGKANQTVPLFLLNESGKDINYLIVPLTRIKNTAYKLDFISKTSEDHVAIK
ncbi:hypothetical protein BOX15_Mlig019720g4 [Macrostomum lignano]|uniref:C2H2-type domain-containing protein n=1 Tax=Macrostomum lignano TaxID=282301 RepID=A0A267FVU3_9PLAT|nr:hypothetical protein BOX15_Mlig019720g4 [Macrostomum lignano]